ncbi:MAG: hypothetical protein KJ676_03350 [Alphaproteobacteria bacterium]|nr:hypothetical protein [Alphaproteobacteria bacterium]MBU1526390.1 hypothetical protein [Alphaproteobacteria bacterium]MBU2117394.1 hypothetical protein [Alphaproteobacteria bacterium]MBU2349970.1 hypothetical protein [Alphaproteobacteria bacterium]MBU2382675.1 hypothetical protein [Alphaproteobacteria bacterium]
MKKSQVLALLVAALSFCLAFMAAGVLLVSAAFMAGGLAVTFWLTRSLVRDVRRRHLDRPA